MSGASFSVCVLAPNGRRQTVKCTPNTTILQIVEEVCKKQTFNPEEYDLRHHKKILDTTTTFRFSGLPNNAQLELVPATRVRSESSITLAVNLEDGSRILGNFTANDTLLNVLNQLCPQSLNQEKAPVIVYTRREIYGKDLANCTLRSLGLTGGRAMIRVLHKSPEELKTQAAVAAPITSKPVEEKPYHRILQHLPSPPKLIEEKVIHKGEIDMELKPDNMTEAKYSDDEKPNYNDEKYQRNNSIDIFKIAQEKGKCKELPASSKAEQKQNLSGSAICADERSTKLCDCVKDVSMEVECSKKCKDTFSTSMVKSIEEDFTFLGSRNAMLFSLESVRELPSEDLPDEFFELTIEDARKILRDVKRQGQGTDNAPLLTAALRNLEESKKQLRQLNRYKKSIIRIQFLDTIVLQGVFAPTDTVASVMEFVREFLDDSSSKFYLYSTPPKCILDENKRLIELGFVPNALIYFGVDNSKLKRGNFLRKDIQDKFTSNSVASLLAAKIRTEDIRNCLVQEEYHDDMEVDNVPIENIAPSTSAADSGSKTVIKSTENVPKWFKQ